LKLIEITGADNHVPGTPQIRPPDFHVRDALAPFSNALTHCR
jgi:hypothetical protein